MHDFLLWCQILKEEKILGKNCTHTPQKLNLWTEGIQVIAKKKVTYKIMTKNQNYPSSLS